MIRAQSFIRWLESRTWGLRYSLASLFNQIGNLLLNTYLDDMEREECK